MKIERQYIPADLKVESWDSVKHYYDELINRSLESSEDLIKWLKDKSELESILEEDLAWRYIKMNCDTTDQKLSDAFRHFVTNIEPKIAPETNKLNKKLVECQIVDKLEDPAYQIMLRSTRQQIQLFREKNVPIKAELQELEQEFGAISSLMTISYKDEELTLPKASNLLKETDRKVRKEVYELINERRLQDKEKLDELLTKLIQKRHQLAVNAGYENYMLYKFDELNRFDYTIGDIEEFHRSIAKEVCPIVNNIYQNKKEQLAYDQLKPYDKMVDPTLLPPLKPFDTSEELINKTIECFDLLNPDFGSYLKTMNEKGFLDLEARKGKAPGGFNYPLYESNVPFIYMNATGNLRDLETMVHEGGHAIHSFLTAKLDLVDFKSTPSEVAELASMSMELLSMKHWDLFFSDKADLQRARLSQLEGVIEVLPWVATVDKFQHWLYTNPYHSVEERKEAWLEIFKEFGDTVTDWTGYEDSQSYLWQKQLHIFEVPFYYIEYAMAQLGAVAVWKNFVNEPESAILKYEQALKLGYTRSIPEIYEAAGTRFDFSAKYINELMQFVKEQMLVIRT